MTDRFRLPESEKAFRVWQLMRGPWKGVRAGAIRARAAALMAMAALVFMPRRGQARPSRLLLIAFMLRLAVLVGRLLYWFPKPVPHPVWSG